MLRMFGGSAYAFRGWRVLRVLRVLHVEGSCSCWPFLKTLEDFVGVEAFAGVEGVGRFRAIFSQRPG